MSHGCGRQAVFAENQGRTVPFPSPQQAASGRLTPEHCVTTAQSLSRPIAWLGTCLAGGFLALCALSGCETDSFLDPSRTGYFEFTPTTMPVLKRLDVVEQVAADNTLVGPPEPEDMIPSLQEYRISAGDVVKVDIYELVTAGETDQSVRNVELDGYIRLPVIGSVPVAGLTVQEVTENITKKLEGFINKPQVTVSLEDSRSFSYRVMGAVERGGLFALARPDLRLLDALALAGGAFPTTRQVRIIRTIDEQLPPTPEQGAPHGAAGAGAAPVPPVKASTPPKQGPATAPPSKDPKATPDIESLIDQLGVGSGALRPATPGGAAPPAGGAGVAPPAGGAGAAPPPRPPASPGVVRGKRTEDECSFQGAAPPVDVDSLEPVRISDDMNAVRDARRQKVAVPQGDGSSYVFDQDKQEWVKLRAGETPPPGAAPQGARTGRDATPGVPPPKKLAGPPTRVIEVSYDDLVAGVPGLNVVVRNGDTIYCDAGERGVVYIDGEVQRPGVYQLPEGGRLTLSRLVSAAGGLGQIAIPERCDLIRRIGDDREATVRVNLAAIRNRGEPDIYMKPDDHVIVGTNFWATPLAVTRNGFRMTYGFGFLLDRNFGNDVFGPPPVNVVGE